MLLLDTHIILFALTGQLAPREQKLLTGDPEWSIAAISLWEISKLHQKKRLAMDFNHPEMIAFLNSLKIWPLTLEICQRMVKLDFESDPADELIAATSLVHSLPLVTRDEKVRRSRLLVFPI